MAQLHYIVETLKKRNATTIVMYEKFIYRNRYFLVEPIFWSKICSSYLQFSVQEHVIISVSYLCFENFMPNTSATSLSLLSNLPI